MTFTTILLPLVLTTLTSKVASQQQSQQDDTPDICLSLRDSNACPAFHQFYVSTGVVDRYPFLPSNITTVQQLDASLLLFVNGTSDYLLPLGCLSTNYSPAPPYARYALTKMCARLIQDEEDSLPCNTEHNVVPPPLCQSTCMDWVDSVTDITSQPRVCSDNSQRTAALANYTTQCMSWHGYNASTDDNCISGFANEPEKCGFRDDIKACQFCQNTTNAALSNCCQRVTCGHTLGVPGVIGITFGAIMVVVLILAGGYFLHSRYFKSRKSKTTSLSSSIGFSFNTNTQNKDKNSHLFPSSTASSYFSDSKTAINDPPKHWPESESTTSLRDPHLHHYQSQKLQQEDHYRVIHAYPPQMEDELALGIGDIIMLALPFDDGWALGVNLATGLKGAFPLVCVSPTTVSFTDARSSRLHSPITTVSSSSCEHPSSSSPVPKRKASKSSTSSSDFISPFLDSHHTY